MSHADTFTGLVGYSNNKQLHIRTGSSTADLGAETVPAGYAVCLNHLNIDLYRLVNSGAVRSDLKDIRIVYCPAGRVPQVIPSKIRTASPGEPDIWFNLQKSIAACSEDSDYYLCYSNPIEQTSASDGFTANEILDETFSANPAGTFLGGGESGWELNVEPSGVEGAFEIVREGASPPALAISRGRVGGPVALGVVGITSKPLGVRPGSKLNIGLSMRILHMEKDPELEKSHRARQVLSGTWLDANLQPLPVEGFEVARIQDLYQTFQSESKQVVAPPEASYLQLSYYICHCNAKVMVDNISVTNADTGVNVAPVVEVYESRFKTKFERKLSGSFTISRDSALVIPSDWRRRYNGHIEGESLIVTRFLEEAITEASGARPEISVFKKSQISNCSIWIGETRNFPWLKSRLDATFPDRPALPPQGYYLAITPGQILVVGTDPAGTFYGCLELASRVKDNRLQGCLVADWPEQEFRAAQYAAFDRSLADEPVCEFIERAARNRINSVALESYSDYYFLNDPKIRNGLVALFAKARACFIEPIPSSFQFRNKLPVCDYNCFAGKWVQDEPYRLEGTTPMEFKRKPDQSPTLGWWGAKIAEPDTDGLYPTVILRTRAARVIVRSSDGKRTYREGQDYVIRGGFKGGTLTPFALARSVKGSIGNGETVLVSYNYMYRPRNDSYSTCLSEPIAREATRQAIHRTISLLKPKYIHINCDEIVGINRDSRDLERKMTGAEIFAELVTSLHRYVKETDPGVKVLMYEDMLNTARGEEAWWANHNAPHYPQAAIDLIPKDIIMCVWNYGTNQGQLKSWADHMCGKGFAVAGTSADYSEASSLAWAWVLKEAKTQGKRVFGSYFTEWAYRDHLNLPAYGASAWGMPVRVLGQEE